MNQSFKKKLKDTFLRHPKYEEQCRKEVMNKINRQMKQRDHERDKYCYRKFGT